MATFERELRSVRDAGLTPLVVIGDSPRWATIQPTSCGAIRSDTFDDFAQFVRALVRRYKMPEFNVHDWELGNEPDVDPALTPTDSEWGCWGNMNDPYYGGAYYGEMLKVVGAAIKAEDPQARVWIGGLLLHGPRSSIQNGRPELFFQGILEAGAAPFFDVVAYHAHPIFKDHQVDEDLQFPWTDLGGFTVGKARYLQQLMAVYGVEKPLFLNETALRCGTPRSPCQPADPQVFLRHQANHVVRTGVRAANHGVAGYIWYLLNYAEWGRTSLLDEENDRKPVYIAYRHLIQQVRGGMAKGAVVYADGIEAYAFRVGADDVHVMWSNVDDTLTVPISQFEFIAAYNRDGYPITPTRTALGDYQISVGVDPVYVLIRGSIVAGE